MTVQNLLLILLFFQASGKHLGYFQTFPWAAQKNVFKCQTYHVEKDGMYEKFLE